MTVRFGHACILIGISAALVLLAASASADSDGVTVLRTIPFSSDANVHQKVKDQCEPQNKVPEFLSKYSERVELVDGPLGETGRVLELTITAVRVKGWFYLSGPKWITIVGVLRENGVEIGNFTAKRITIGYLNMTACGAGRRCADALGRDIAEWLENPQKDSKLGSA
jgi:hypothetical protein